jgi:hypothetical protein
MVFTHISHLSIRVESRLGEGAISFVFVPYKKGSRNPIHIRYRRFWVSREAPYLSYSKSYSKFLLAEAVKEFLWLYMPRLVPHSSSKETSRKQRETSAKTGSIGAETEKRRNSLRTWEPTSPTMLRSWMITQQWWLLLVEEDVFGPSIGTVGSRMVVRCEKMRHFLSQYVFDLYPKKMHRSV